jgi:hypothetical protein
MRHHVIALAALALSAPLAAQTREDSTGIRNAALDYIEGWYSANVERMTRALHPELQKRIVNIDSLGNPWVSNQGASHLIRNTRLGGGSRTPPAQIRTDVHILDVFRGTASVRVDAGTWVDYLHLVKWRGQWVILNVLWEVRQQP